MARNNSNNGGCGCLILIVIAIAFVVNKCNDGDKTSTTKEKTITNSSSYQRSNMADYSQKEELSKSLLTKDGIIQYINKFKYGDKDSIEYKRNIIDNFVNAVYVFDDYLIIVFNCKAGTKRVSLSTASELSGSDVDTQSPPGSDSP